MVKYKTLTIFHSMCCTEKSEEMKFSMGFFLDFFILTILNR